MTDTIEIRSQLEDECDRLASENRRLLARVQGQEEEIVKLMAWNERLVDENGKLLVRLKALEGVAEDMERLWGRYEKLEAENKRYEALLNVANISLDCDPKQLKDEMDNECQQAAFDNGRAVGAVVGELAY